MGNEADNNDIRPPAGDTAWADPSAIFRCIFCPAPATSREHIFPSALGGKRTDSQIYCKTHNQALGPYVASLLEVLQFFNAQLDMVTDRRDEPQPFSMTNTSDGSAILASARAAHPDVDIPGLVANLSAGQNVLPLTSDDQRARFLQLAKNAGWNVTVKGTTEDIVYSHDRWVAHLTFGTDDFFRAVVYTALTFFAHAFPLQARHPHLTAVKRALRAGEAYAGKDRLADKEHHDVHDYAWWTSHQEAWTAQNPFEFGHTVAVCQRAGVAYGYVSFFGVANYAVRLAEGLPGDDDGTLTFINPVEPQQPREWQHHRGSGFCFDPEHAREDVRSDAFSHQMHDRLNQLVAQILMRQAQRRDDAFVSAVNAARSGGRAAVMAAVEQQLRTNRQIVFNNLLQMREHSLELPGFDAFVVACTTPDPTGPNGLSREGAAVMTAVLKALTSHVALRAALGPLDTAFVADVLTGINGRAVLLTEVLHGLLTWGRENNITV